MLPILQPTSPLSFARRAFTLVELLLVITIIAILVSITIPALGSSRETARRVKCLANLKGIGGGIAAYMNDSQDLLPRVRALHNSSGNANANDPSLLDVMVVYLSISTPEREDPTNPNSPFTHVSDSLICPCDRIGTDQATNFEPVWRTSGCSYEYLAGIGMGLAELATVRDPQGAMTQTYRDPKWKDLPVLLDYGDWHTARRIGKPRNALYFGDWHSDWVGALSSFDSQNPRLQELVCDVLSRYGGIPVPGCN